MRQGSYASEREGGLPADTTVVRGIDYFVRLEVPSGIAKRRWHRAVRESVGMMTKCGITFGFGSDIKSVEADVAADLGQPEPPVELRCGKCWS